ncbi:RagB/SusD family nutrient uptake outer membrane protein [Fulvivirga ulvae]|uniref:RagB/SusD family nutrient uptake outer membrane protein n=1 Tax=Fulvivirga ulvae TaxID=2904245 RepID=UPI001F33AE9E|nr:RagB/SusD family nutrient uptake outer membrane protein [Fulvivirga ulvae]UII30791.1 RagB/SusD family nutrient uptake outer membrane protein [Fulvivirga ulvae]
MKNIIDISKLLLIVGSFSFIVGCSDLETELTDSVPVETESGEFEGDPTELLSSAYNRLGRFPDQTNIYALMEHTSDEMIGPTRGTDWGDNGIWRTLHAHTWDATHAYVLGSWNDLNTGVFTCNQVLASNPSANQAAQAKFLRAFYMFYIMDFYGQVPFRGVNDGVEVSPEVFNREEAFNFIVKDLTEALPDLADGNSTATTEANKATAHALLAKLYLNKAVYFADNPAGPYTFDAADMNKVIEHADAVTAAGYTLETGNYFDIFATPVSSEIIFTSPEGSPENRFRMTLHYNQTPDGWNGFTTLADFYNKFESDEQRIGEVRTTGLGTGFLIGQQYGPDGTALKDRGGNPLVFTPEIDLAGNNERAGIRVIKYHPSDAGDYILFRYADVYLMKLEAILRGGTPTMAQTAQSMLDDLRTIRGASALTVSLDVILDERGRELYWEGWRRNDQIRFGTFTTTWEEKEVTDSHRVLFPIPQQALDSNPNLEQNTGY